MDEGVNLGPVINAPAATAIRKQVNDAVSMGAFKNIPDDLFPVAKEGTAFVAPQILTNVTHSMTVMTEETFGPIFGIMKVKSDAEAISLMNDSKFGLTVSLLAN